MRGVGTLVIAAAVMSAAAGLASAQSKPAAAKAVVKKNPVAATEASIKAGQQIYHKQCRHCHGLRGKGDGPTAPSDPKPADLTDAKWDYGASDGEIFNVIWNGAPKPSTKMLGMQGTLAERDVWSIVNYLRAISPKPSTSPKPGTK